MKLQNTKRIFLSLLLICVLTTVPLSLFAAKKPIVLKLVHPMAPNDYPLGTGLEDLAKKFNDRANGEYRMEVHAGGALVQMGEYFDAIRIGIVEMVSTSWSIFAYLDPKLGITEAPFLFNNQEAAQYATKELTELYDEILRKKFNSKALGLGAFSGSELVGTVPIRTLEDIQSGLLIGAVSPAGSAMIKSLGGKPMTVLPPDLYEVLQKHVIDSTFIMVAAANSFGLFNVGREATLIYGYPVFHGLTINLKVYNKMPPHIKQILHEEVDANHAWLREVWPAHAKRVLKDLSKQGVNIYTMPIAERNRLVEASAEYRDEVIRKHGEFGQKILDISKRANRLYPNE